MAYFEQEGKFRIEKRDGRWYPTIDGDDTGRDYGTLAEARFWCRGEAIKDLKEYLRYALEWIDAVPADVVGRLPAMPGFDRDEAEALMED